MPKLTYIGPFDKGSVLVPQADGPDKAIRFVRGEPVEFTPDEAKHLPSEEWKSPTTKAAQAAPSPEED